MINTPKVKEKMDEKAIHIRLDLNPEDPLRDEFEEIKEATGVKSNVEVLRLTIRKCYRERSQLFKGEKG